MRAGALISAEDRRGIVCRGQKENLDGGGGGILYVRSRAGTKEGGIHEHGERIKRVATCRRDTGRGRSRCRPCEKYVLSQIGKKATQPKHGVGIVWKISETRGGGREEGGGGFPTSRNGLKRAGKEKGGERGARDGRKRSGRGARSELERGMPKHLDGAKSVAGRVGGKKKEPESARPLHYKVSLEIQRHSRERRGEAHRVGQRLNFSFEDRSTIRKNWPREARKGGGQHEKIWSVLSGKL